MAVGRFTDPAIKPCRILEAELITRPSVNDGIRESTNTVRVTFEGRVVPNFIAVGKLHIRARPFLKWPMFCDKCLLWGHTIKFCRRKQKYARCSGEHKEESCTNPTVNKTLCPFCHLKHAKGMANCAYMRKVAKDHMKKQKVEQRARYQQLVSTTHILPPANIRPRSAQY